MEKRCSEEQEASERRCAAAEASAVELRGELAAALAQAAEATKLWHAGEKHVGEQLELLTQVGRDAPSLDCPAAAQRCGAPRPCLWLAVAETSAV